MPERQDIFINQAAQGVVPIEEAVVWFNERTPDDRLSILRDLLFFACQAGAWEGDVPAAIEKAHLKPTFTPCVLVSKGRLREQLGKVLSLPEHEREKSFRLLLSLLAIADARQRETRCADGCAHWWHANLQRAAPSASEEVE